MDNDTKKIEDATAYESEKEILHEGSEADEATELEDSELIFEDDAEALEQLREFEASVNGSFKRSIIISSIILGAAALAGVIFALVL